MAKTIRLSDETKEALDAFVAGMQRAGEGTTADEAVSRMLDIAERHEGEEALGPYESDAVALVRRILSRAGDEMAGVLLHEVRSREESDAEAERVRAELTRQVAEVASERDALRGRVSELESLEAEVEALRAKVAEADEVRANTERLVADMARQRQELLERFAAQAEAQAALLEEVRASREEAAGYRMQIQELLTKLGEARA